jgi:hypothetical protein
LFLRELHTLAEVREFVREMISLHTLLFLSDLTFFVMSFFHSSIPKASVKKEKFCLTQLFVLHCG